ncbi:MAG: hypothetical protein SVU32_04995, partial [Candidatus Nanohaloarchaea archaeon]|nr:hypothetical protein [Candidatus Nanohaloarchaea archaeon]
MGLHLKRKDYQVIGLLVALSVLAGFGMNLSTGPTLLAVHDATFYLPGPVLLIGGLFIYLARDKYSGTLARNLEVVGLSMGILGITWVLWSKFFAAGFPSWGVSAAFWTTFLGMIIT